MNKASITVVDWNKFNPRNDQKSHSWFRMENDFFIKTFSWSHEQQRLFLFICGLFSKNNGKSFGLDMELAKAILKRKEKQILEDLAALETYGVVHSNRGEMPETITSSYVPDPERNFPDPYTTNVTNERTNERNSGQSQAIDPQISDPLTDKLLETVKPEIQQTWIKTYQDCSWIKSELKKVNAYLIANPHKGKRKGPFITNWFNRGWDSHQKKIPTQRPFPAPIKGPSTEETKKIIAEMNKPTEANPERIKELMTVFRSGKKL